MLQAQDGGCSMIPNNGLQALAQIFAGEISNPLGGGVGTGTTAPTTGDTGLQTELHVSSLEGRDVAEEVTITLPPGQFLYRITLTLTEPVDGSGSASIYEFGMFTESGYGKGVIISRATFDEVFKTSLIYLRFEELIEVERA
jgi:hypothetical protein